MARETWETFYSLYREFKERNNDQPAAAALAQVLWDAENRRANDEQQGIVALFSTTTAWEAEDGATWAMLRDRLRDAWTTFRIER